MARNKSKKELKVPRPFLKWAGGKTQLLLELEKRLPESVLENKVIKRYVEPFVGGGALFFFLKRDYDVKKSLLLDINPELVMAYQVIQKNHKKTNTAGSILPQCLFFAKAIYGSTIARLEYPETRHAAP